VLFLSFCIFASLLSFLVRKMEPLESVEDDDINDNMEFREIAQLYVSIVEFVCYMATCLTHKTSVIHCHIVSTQF